MLNIIGGSYIEICKDPSYIGYYGSGIRAAAALSGKEFEITLHTCISEETEWHAKCNSKIFRYNLNFQRIPRTIQFDYYHPLSHPSVINYDPTHTPLKIMVEEKGDYLYYGMLEATTRIDGGYVVYDPQNHKSFKETNSSAEHLAVVLNKNEAQLLSEMKSNGLIAIGFDLLKTENADVIVIKNGAKGAMVFEKDQIQKVPIYETASIWPIGSGDVFSAVFAWKWIIERKSGYEAAMEASMITANYCLHRHLPVMMPSKYLEPITSISLSKKIYLAGPFITIAQRWLINELRNYLIEFGNEVFSPYHDVGTVQLENVRSEATKIAKADIEGLNECSVLVAVQNPNSIVVKFDRIGVIESNNEIEIHYKDIPNKLLCNFENVYYSFSGCAEYLVS